jgi:hypothetical protein
MFYAVYLNKPGVEATARQRRRYNYSLIYWSDDLAKAKHFCSLVGNFNQQNIFIEENEDVPDTYKMTISPINEEISFDWKILGF